MRILLLCATLVACQRPFLPLRAALRRVPWKAEAVMHKFLSRVPGCWLSALLAVEIEIQMEVRAPYSLVPPQHQ